MTAAYPAGLPVPSSQLTIKVETGLVSTTFQSGRMRRTGAPGKFIFGASLAWLLLDSEYSIFSTWWRDSLSFGSLPFLLPMDTGGGDLNHKVQFIGLPSRTKGVLDWQVACEAKVIDRPTNLAPDWADNYKTAPASWPADVIGGPQQAIKVTPVLAFIATSGLGSAAALNAPRGEVYQLSWLFDASELNYFIKWFSDACLFGRAPFVATFDTLGTMKYSIVEDPQIKLSGMFYTLSVKCIVSASNGVNPVPSADGGWGLAWGDAWGGS